MKSAKLALSICLATATGCALEASDPGDPSMLPDVALESLTVETRTETGFTAVATVDGEPVHVQYTSLGDDSYRLRLEGYLDEPYAEFTGDIDGPSAGTIAGVAVEDALAKGVIVTDWDRATLVLRVVANEADRQLQESVSDRMLENAFLALIDVRDLLSEETDLTSIAAGGAGWYMFKQWYPSKIQYCSNGARWKVKVRAYGTMELSWSTGGPNWNSTTRWRSSLWRNHYIKTYSRKLRYYNAFVRGGFYNGDRSGTYAFCTRY